MSGGLAEQHAEHGRLAGLDSLRGIAACVVAFGYHVKLFFRPGDYVPQWGGPLTIWMRDFGWSAVDLFFVLSGFVFAHVYLARGNRLQQPSGAADFWVARFARLYPLHLAMLLISAFLFSAVPANTLSAFIAHVFMLQAFHEPVARTFVGATWSLSIEFLCYVLFATAAALGARTIKPLAFAALGIGIAGILSSSDIAANESTVCAAARGLAGFFCGQLLWLYRGKLNRVGTAVLAVLGGAAIAASAAAGPQSPFGLLPLTLVAWPALLLLSLRLRAFRWPVFQWLGDRSYAIYLLHMPMIDVVAFAAGGLPGNRTTIILAQIGLIVCTLTAADLVYRRFEMPMRLSVQRLWAQRRIARSAVA